ncbi:YdeI/OmpD-associated family protein [Mangrovibacterium lignilyticum]|uniref:YdeI/OmpD-associated family protein n=1 Tax=Mangrovibacterium lignilyticum TaxID=2668052 RepID=UPI0013D282A0|nr:YdeI/OmpD-associated family protein [Mangrovibacterium lignilyticum]
MAIKRFEYSTILFPMERGIPGTFAGFPFDVRKEFGTGGPVRINCWIDGVHKTGSLVPIGNSEHAIYIRKEILKKVGKKEGDEVRMVVEQDLSPKVLEVPEDFQWLLDEDQELKEKFEALSFSYKEGIVNYINQAKRPETRVKRIENFIQRVRVGFYPGQKLE